MVESWLGSCLDFDVVDLDIFQNVDVGNLGLSVAGCVRFGHLDHHFFAYERTTDDDTDTLEANHGFDGADPTL